MALVMKSLDPAYFDDRLHYSYIENPAETRGTGNDREYKDDAIVRVTNTGSTSIQISSAMVDGPFVVQSPAKLVGAVIAPGASIDVTVAFDRAAYAAPTGTLGRIDNTSTVFEGKLTLNAGGGQSASVDMSGFWQLYPEKNMEPNLNEIWQVFGFGNEIENLPFAGSGGRSVLSNDGVYEALDETEVLSPYWRIADGYSAMTITQIAAYHGPGGAPVQIHAPGDTAQAQRLWRGAADDNQQLLPNAGVSATEFATKTVSSIPAAWGADGAFALWVANFSSDPSLNAVGDHLVDVNGVRYRIRDETTARDENGVIYQIADLDLAQQGHWLRIFQAVDKNGAVIPNVYLAAMDYSGVNSDFNDNLFIIEGVTPIAVDGAHMRGQLGGRLVPAHFLARPELAATGALGELAHAGQILGALLGEGLNHRGDGLEAGRIGEERLPEANLEALHALRRLDLFGRREHPVAGHLAEVAGERGIASTLTLEILEGLLGFLLGSLELQRAGLDRVDLERGKLVTLLLLVVTLRYGLLYHGHTPSRFGLPASSNGGGAGFYSLGVDLGAFGGSRTTRLHGACTCRADRGS